MCITYFTLILVHEYLCICTTVVYRYLSEQFVKDNIFLEGGNLHVASNETLKLINTFCNGPKPRFGPTPTPSTTATTTTATLGRLNTLPTDKNNIKL